MIVGASGMDDGMLFKSVCLLLNRKMACMDTRSVAAMMPHSRSRNGCGASTRIPPEIPVNEKKPYSNQPTVQKQVH